MKKRTEAEGEILWVDENIVGYRCVCGAELVIDAEMNDKPDWNVCHCCNRRHILIQTNTVYEIEQC